MFQQGLARRRQSTKHLFHALRRPCLRYLDQRHRLALRRFPRYRGAMLLVRRQPRLPVLRLAQRLLFSWTMTKVTMRVPRLFLINSALTAHVHHAMALPLQPQHRLMSLLQNAVLSNGGHCRIQGIRHGMAMSTDSLTITTSGGRQYLATGGHNTSPNSLAILEKHSLFCKYSGALL